MRARPTETSGYLRDKGVSRETLDLLDAYVELLAKWNKAINLVSKSTLDQVWSRHIEDSAQLLDHAEIANGLKWADFGSGGGLPAIVISIMLKGKGAETEMHLVESDHRKCSFLRTVDRELNLGLIVHQARVEEIAPLSADIITARAFASLNDLMGYTARHLAENGKALFLKGRSFEVELTEAQKVWHIEPEVIPSVTDSSARILKFEGIPIASQG